MNSLNSFLANAGICVTNVPQNINEKVQIKDVKWSADSSINTNFQADNGVCVGNGSC
jgi:hypothetical protein